MPNIGLLLMILTLFLLPSSMQTANAQEEHLIRVGFDSSLPPLSYLDADVRPTGFDIELMRNAAALRGYQIDFIPLDWEDAVQQLKTGQLDVVVGMKYTATRDEIFDFSDSYLTMSDSLVVPGTFRDISNMQDLKGKVVAIQREDPSITQLEGIRGGKLLVAFTQPDALQMVFLGKADAFLGNRWTADYILEKTNHQKDYRIRTGLLPPSDYAFAVREGNYELLRELNKGLAELHHNGTYEQLYSQFLQPYNALAIRWWRKLVFGLLFVIGVTVSILAAIFFWNKRLQKEVRKQTAALADTFAFQTKVLDSVDNGILSFDTMGRINLINHVARNLLGIDETQFHPDIKDVLPQLPIHQALEAGNRQMVEGEIRVEDGTGRILHYYLASLYNGVGEQIGGILSLQDRTEQKHLQARLIAQEKMRALGQLVAGIAHEIRNPLTAIKTFVELLPKKLDDPRFRTELVEHVPGEVARMNRIIQDLLDYSREKPMQLGWEKLHDLVHSVTSLFKKQIQSEQIHLLIEISPDLEVWIDRDRIKQVLMNLILNALDAMASSKDKTLMIHGQKKGTIIQLTVSDTGKGIEEQDLIHLFQPFYTTKSQGIGLGLYISQRIMQEHGGGMKVKSTVGSGTTFILNFIEGGEKLIERFDH